MGSGINEPHICLEYVMPAPNPPVVFIHGLWLHATSWQPWIELFQTAGYPASAPGWPGEPGTVAEARAQPQRQAGTGIAAVLRHYAQIIEAAGTRPILVGHSFGGIIAQQLLGQELAAAAIAIDPAPVKGVWAIRASQLRAGFPVLANPANKNRSVSLTAAQFRYAFGSAVSAREAAQLYEAWSIPAPGRPLFEAVLANLIPHSAARVDTRNGTRGPLLLISGLRDRAVPDAVTYAAYRQYRHSAAVTELKRIAGRGHSLTIDSGWREVADTALSWLNALGRQPGGIRPGEPDHPDHPAREPGGWGLYLPKPGQDS
jgi:pimeloyl-ACP methyl ester carboxylesterase